MFVYFNGKESEREKMINLWRDKIQFRINDDGMCNGVLNVYFHSITVSLVHNEIMHWLLYILFNFPLVQVKKIKQLSRIRKKIKLT